MKRLVFLLPLLLGCAELGAIGSGLQTARDVAKAGCAILQATDGSSADVLASLAAMQRTIVEAQAADAKNRGADVDALVESTARLARAIEASSLAIVKAAGNGPARLPSCPVDPTAP